MQYSLALHVISLVLWIGGLMIVTMLMKNVSAAGEAAGNGWRSGVQKVLRGFILPGMGLAILTGIYQIALRGAGFYMKQGWFHAKLTLVLGLIVVTVLARAEIVRATQSGKIDGKRVMMLHGATGAILIAVVFITMLGRAA